MPTGEKQTPLDDEPGDGRDSSRRNAGASGTDPDAGAGSARPPEASAGIRPVEVAPESGGSNVMYLAEFGLTHPDVVLGETLRATGGVSFRLEYRTLDDANTPLLFLRVADGGEADVRAALEADDTVADPTVVVDLGDHRIYRVRAVTDLELVPPRCTQYGTRTLDARTSGREWRLRLQFLVPEALDAFRQYNDEHGVDYRIHELTWSETLEDDRVLDVSDGQRETLLAAYEMGYFDVPRRATQADLAARLDVSTSAVSQRLRRATGTLVASTLDADRGRR